MDFFVGDPMYPMDFDVDSGLDWEYPVKEFDVFSFELTTPAFFLRQSLAIAPDLVIENNLKRLRLLQGYPR